MCIADTFLTRRTPGFQKLILSAKCVYVSVCPPLRLVITSGMIWTPYDWLNKHYSFCMAAIVGIVNRRGLGIEACRRSQPNKSKLALYKPLLRLCNHLKQPYISNKTKRFSHKGGCGVRGRTRIEAFKRRAGLGYILMVSCYQ